MLFEFLKPRTWQLRMTWCHAVQPAAAMQYTLLLNDDFVDKSLAVSGPTLWNVLHCAWPIADTDLDLLCFWRPWCYAKLMKSYRLRDSLGCKDCCVDTKCCYSLILSKINSLKHCFGKIQPTALLERQMNMCGRV